MKLNQTHNAFGAAPDRRPSGKQPKLSCLANFLDKRLTVLNVSKAVDPSPLKADKSSFQQTQTTQPPESLDLRRWRTVAQMAKANPAFTENSLRYLIYSSKPRKRAESKAGLGDVPANGLAPAIKKIGRKILIDEQAFLEWIAAH